MTAEDGERGGSSDVWRKKCSTDERLQPETLCRRQWTVDRRIRWTSRDVDEAERSRRLDRGLLVDVL